MQFADRARVYDHAPGQDGAYASLSLVIGLQDFSRVHILAHSQTEDSGRSIHEIAVQEIDEDGFGHKHHRYYADEEGVVRRFDVEDAYEEHRKDPRKPELDFTAGSREVLAALSELVASAKNEEANAQLEQDMGLNSQPIERDELQRLAELLSLATPRDI